MKLLFILLFSPLYFLYAFADTPFYGDLDLTRVTTNYNGSAYNGASMLVYGEGGIIIKSTNGGADWERIALNDSLNILNIVNIGPKYIGLCKHRYGIISGDNGASWTTVDLGENNWFSQLIEKDGLLYALNMGRINVYDVHLNKIKDYEISNSYFPKSFAVVGNKLVCNEWESKIAIINMDSDEKTTLSLKSFGVCQDCEPISSIVSDDSVRAYFVIDDILFRVNVLTNSITKVASRIGLSKAAIAPNDGSLYAIHSAPQTDHLDLLYFEYFDKTDESYKKVNTGVDKGFINELSFTNLNRISKDTLIGVGKNSLIYISYNAGLNWKLISHSGSFWLDAFAFNSKELRAVGNYGLFYHSVDGGATWLPQENYIGKISKNMDFYFPQNSNGGYMFFDKNNGFIHVEPNYLGQENIIYTNDGGRTTKSKSEYYLYRENFYPIHLKYKDQPLWISSGIYEFGWWAMIFKMDDTLNVQKQVNLERRILFSAFVDGDTIYALGKDSVDGDGVFSVYSSTDGGENWNKDFSAPTDPILKNNRPSMMTCLNNSFIVDWNSYLYKFDVKKKTGRLILNKDTSRTLRPIYLNGKYYIGFYQFTKPNITTGLISIADPDADLVTWEYVNLKRYGIPVVYNSRDDSLYFMAATDSLMGSSATFLAWPKGYTGVKEQSAQDRREEISITGPMAASVEGEFDFKLEWISSDPLENTRFAAYDARGAQVNSGYTIIPKAVGQAELRWTPGKLPPGAYIILLRIGNSIGSKTVIID